MIDGSKILCTVLGEGVHFFFHLFFEENIFIVIHYFSKSTHLHPEFNWHWRLFIMNSIYVCFHFDKT